MQIKDEETSFWKGEIRGEKINGSVHVQRPSGDNTTAYYKGELATGGLKRKSAPKPAVVQKPAAPKPVVAKPVAQVVPPVVKEELVEPVVEDVEQILEEKIQAVENK
jgi:hypothetical protein